MLKQLIDRLPEIRELTKDESQWNSLIINRRKPHTYRIFHVFPDNMRVCLHRFSPCHDHEAFQHPHPWPGAFLIMNGSYEMTLGMSKDRFSKPENVAKTMMSEYSGYEILNPLTWHSVIPLETTHTIMMNGEPWSEDIAHSEVRTTKGKDLDKMDEQEVKNSLGLFRIYIDHFFRVRAEPKYDYETGELLK